MAELCKTHAAAARRAGLLHVADQAAQRLETLLLSLHRRDAFLEARIVDAEALWSAGKQQLALRMMDQLCRDAPLEGMVRGSARADAAALHAHCRQALRSPFFSITKGLARARAMTLLGLWKNTLRTAEPTVVYHDILQPAIDALEAEPSAPLVDKVRLVISERGSLSCVQPGATRGKWR